MRYMTKKTVTATTIGAMIAVVCGGASSTREDIGGQSLPVVVTPTPTPTPTGTMPASPTPVVKSTGPAASPTPADPAPATTEPSPVPAASATATPTATDTGTPDPASTITVTPSPSDTATHTVAPADTHTATPTPAQCGGLNAMLVIEHPSIGATYSRDEYGVYEYSTYPESSVLAGQEKRSFRDCFPTLEEAKAAYPKAEWTGGTGYREIVIPDTPPQWFDPANGETWAED